MNIFPKCIDTVVEAANPPENRCAICHASSLLARLLMLTMEACNPRN
jgi:hypothetical protein